jgi:hypothetical protein
LEGKPGKIETLKMVLTPMDSALLAGALVDALAQPLRHGLAIGNEELLSFMVGLLLRDLPACDDGSSALISRQFRGGFADAITRQTQGGPRPQRSIVVARPFR